jgi:rod shape-determining protein MreC
MKRFSYKPYILLATVLFGMFLMPTSGVEGLRSLTVATLSPPWRVVHFLKTSLFRIATIAPATASPQIQQEIQILRQENHQLRSQVHLLKQYLASEELLDKQKERVKTLGMGDAFFKRRSLEVLRLLEMQSQAVMAKVIFREPASWSSSFWVNVGERNNQLMGSRVVTKNSPVVIGTSVVGIVDYVGKRKSRIRLLTDSGVRPSVRAVRGSEQNRTLLEKVHSLISLVKVREELRDIVPYLEKLKEALAKKGTSLYLAKGEVSGSSQPLWRSLGLTLKGVGFNYDFADEEGPARQIEGEIPLLRAGDLLVTTGLDGVFPAGLSVAYVTHIDSLREGGAAYDLEAKAAVDHLEDLSFVTIIPPLDEISESM